jgi:ATP-dependent DNA helicase RecG
MDKKQLLYRLKFHEWDDFEVKESRKEVPKDIWKTVSAFSNTDGGIIVLGIEETGEGKFQISGVENIEKIQNNFISTLRGEKFNIPLSTKGHLFDFDGKKVLLFRIHAMSVSCKPIYYGGDIRNTFTRQGSGDHRCSKEEINRMLRQASELSSDSMILEGYTIDDIDSETVTIYKRYLSIKDPENPFLQMDKTRFLKKLGCLIPNKHSTGKQDELTMAGLLLFGKEDFIRQRFPAWELDIYLVPGDDRIAQGVRWNARKIYEVNLVKTYLQAIEYLKSKIDIPFALAEDHITRTEEVPVVLALREGLVNMIIHRDYFEHGQSRVKIYQDRIEMYNPGSAPKTVEEIIEDEVTEPRNPIIAKVFRIIGWAEVAGSGMMKILKNWKAAGYVEPSIKNNIQGYSFKMIFPFKEMSDGYRIGIKSPIKEDASAGSHLVERSLYDFVNERENDTENDIAPDIVSGTDGPENGPDEPVNGPVNEPVKLSRLQERIVELVKEKKDITIDEIAGLIGKSTSTIKRHMSQLKEKNVLEHVGSDKNGYWKIENNESENEPVNEPVNVPDEPVNEPVKLTRLQERIVELVKEKKDITIDEISGLMGKSTSTIKRHMSQLKEKNVLGHVGSDKNGYWKIESNESENDPENGPDEPVSEPVNEPVNEPVKF